MARKQPHSKSIPTALHNPTLSAINHHAAGGDIGADRHFVAVPPDCAPEPVRRFGVFTADLYAMADWLADCGVTTVAMESTGVYWIPLFEVLEECGFDVRLVDARRARERVRPQV